MIKPRGFDAVFVKKEKLTADTNTFYFKRPADFDYNPGQYMKLILKIKNPDERGNFRYFTISSSPTEKEYLTITTRIIKSSFKKTLAGLKAKSIVRIFGPLDGLDFDPKDKRQRVFLAGGIGITPYHSILHYVVDKRLKIPIILFSSFKTPEEFIFIKEFNDIEKNHPWFKFIPTITQSGDSTKNWNNHVGRIDAELIRKNVPRIKSSFFNVTGPEQMVMALSEVVESLGMKQKNIQKETFPGY